VPREAVDEVLLAAVRLVGESLAILSSNNQTGPRSSRTSTLALSGENLKDQLN